MRRAIMTKRPLEQLFGGDGVIGRDVHTRKLVRLKEPQRSTYVIGAHGTGKSTLLQRMIVSDISKCDKAVVVIDPHADLINGVLLRCPASEAERVILFAPGEQRERPLGLNPFEWTEERERSDKVSAILKVFNHLWYGSFSQTPTLQNTLEVLSRTLFAAYPTHHTHFFHMLLLVGEGPLGDHWREKLGAMIADNPVAARKWSEWQRSDTRKTDMQSSKDKIAHIIGDETIQHVLCQQSSADCFRFQEMLGNKGVILINLNGLEAESKKLVGSIILTQLLAMGYQREDKADRVPLHIFCDEFDLFAAASFSEIIAKARKFGIFLTIANQTLAQVDVVAQRAALSCANKLVFQVNAEDARVLEAGFLKDRSFPEGGFAHLPLYEAAVRVADKRETVQAHVLTLPEEGEENEEVAQEIRRRSAAYGRPRADIEEHLAKLTKIPDESEEEDFWE
jgi:DNA segregation ATPase FtsK/SpoIIIE-like protein